MPRLLIAPTTEATSNKILTDMNQLSFSKKIIIAHNQISYLQVLVNSHYYKILKIPNSRCTCRVIH